MFVWRGSSGFSLIIIPWTQGESENPYIWIRRKGGVTQHREEGAYKLSHDQLISVMLSADLYDIIHHDITTTSSSCDWNKYDCYIREIYIKIIKKLNIRNYCTCSQCVGFQSYFTSWVLTLVEVLLSANFLYTYCI